ncbi:MAG: IS66 family insertion sequence hypothetical protein [Gammaproteobacteria bacterium]|nr:MAG: IS66 family insertion sequence hypothetical protein [Gammaproteobacteria bacterium]
MAWATLARVSLKRSFHDFDTIYLHRDAVDFRKSINGLSVIVEQAMNLSPFDAALFVFCNKQRDKLKVLYWDNTGFCLWYKRLEKDRFKWPRKASEATLILSAEQFDWLLRGMNISQIKPHQTRLFKGIA